MILPSLIELYVCMNVHGFSGLTVRSWLVPSFWQNNLCLVVSGHRLLVSVTKFQDKFAHLQQVNSPSSWDKFQICCTDMYSKRFQANFVVFCMFL